MVWIDKVWDSNNWTNKLQLDGYNTELEKAIFGKTNVIIIYWGQLWDEWKWKVTSQFRDVDRVAAATGGWNAWHTVYFDNGNKAAFHELPGWAIIEKARVYLGQWRVIFIPWLEEEIQELEKNNIPTENKIVIAWNAHVVLPLHKRLDWRIEEIKWKAAVWTTKKWIWPSYGSKALRIWITFNQLLEWDRSTIDSIINTNAELRKYGRWKIYEEIDEAKKGIEKLISEWKVSIDKTNMTLNHAARDSKRIVIEHSQSTLLALDGWMYPYCTSSDTSVNGVFSWVNIANYGKNIAVMKCIKSKVGWWYFPTKIEWEMADIYREMAWEYGATTKRPRDIGRFDTVEARNVLAKNHTDWIVFTKADLLKELNAGKMQIAESYNFNNGEEVYVDTLPHLPQIYKDLTVKYTDPFTLKWDISGLKNRKNLPASYRKYFDAKIELLDFKGKVWIGTGAGRNDFFIYK
jgi:adenylosuccinate synthase